MTTLKNGARMQRPYLPTLQLPGEFQCISAAQPAAVGNALLVKARGWRLRESDDELQTRHDPGGLAADESVHRRGVEAAPKRCAIEQPEGARSAEAAFIDMRLPIWLTGGVNF